VPRIQLTRLAESPSATLTDARYRPGGRRDP